MSVFMDIVIFALDPKAIQPLGDVKRLALVQFLPHTCFDLLGEGKLMFSIFLLYFVIPGGVTCDSEIPGRRHQMGSEDLRIW